MDTSELDRTLSELTSTLGDPTRRGIYIAVRESPEAMTASRISQLFGIHTNVARHHLDRLAADGYLRVTRRRPPGKGGPGAGRPAKCYEATEKEIDFHYPARRYDLLAELLLRVIGELAPAHVSDVAVEVGRRYGTELAAEIGLPDQAGFQAAVKAVAGAMTGVGFVMGPDEDGLNLLTSHCPFGQTATAHPEVICSLDRGIVTGLMEALHQDCKPEVVPHSSLDEECVTRVAITRR